MQNTALDLMICGPISVLSYSLGFMDNLVVPTDHSEPLYV